MIGPSCSQKCPKGLSFDALFSQFSVKQRHPERDGSQVAFPFCFLWFPGPALDPLAPAQSKRSLPFRPANQNSVVFLTILYTFLVLLASEFVQKTIKIELESNICEGLCFVCSGCVFGSFM